jgi:hypothetical protein
MVRRPVGDHRERADDQNGARRAEVEDRLPRRDGLAEADVVGEEEARAFRGGGTGDDPHGLGLVVAQGDGAGRRRRRWRRPAVELALDPALPRVGQGQERDQRGRQGVAFIEEDAVLALPAGAAGGGHRAHGEWHVEHMQAARARSGRRGRPAAAGTCRRPRRRLRRCRHGSLAEHRHAAWIPRGSRSSAGAVEGGIGTGPTARPPRMSRPRSRIAGVVSRLAWVGCHDAAG